MWVRISVISFFSFQIDKALNLSEKEKKELDASDFGDLKTAIEHLAKLRSESKELESLRKEMLDYAEDLKDLERIKVRIIDQIMAPRSNTYKTTVF